MASDLIAIPPGSEVLFRDKTKKCISKLQEYRMSELKGYGFKTEVYRGVFC